MQLSERAKLWWSLPLAATLVLAACGGGTDDGAVLTDPTSSETSESRVSDSSGAADNPAAELLGFSAEALDGSTVEVGDFVGQDLVVWFWEPH